MEHEVGDLVHEMSSPFRAGFVGCGDDFTGFLGDLGADFGNAAIQKQPHIGPLTRRSGLAVGDYRHQLVQNAALVHWSSWVGGLVTEAVSKVPCEQRIWKPLFAEGSPPPRSSNQIIRQPFQRSSRLRQRERFDVGHVSNVPNSGLSTLE
jgi:hypothetical protein